MDDVGRYIIYGAVLLCSVIFAMVISLFDSSLQTINESKLRKLSEDNNKKAKELLKLKEDEVESSLKLNICASVWIIIAFFVSVIIINNLRFWGGAVNTVPAVLLRIAIYVLALFLILVVSKVTPRLIAAIKPEPLIYNCYYFANAILCVFSPITFLLIKASRLISRILGYNPNSNNVDITEDEIRMMVDAGNESGSIELSEREMINNIFEFDDRNAGDVMTHRTDVISVSKEDGIEEVIKLAIEEGFSRIPVYGDDIDDIIGVIYVKDLLALIGDSNFREKKIEDYMRPILYVPESTRCLVLFREFKEKKTHMAVVVDEYGGTAGIATMEDLLESIVGNIQDEYDEEEEEASQIDENTYSLDGGILVEDAEKILKAELSDDDSDTLGGLISNTLGIIPSEGETPSIVIGNYKFTVMSVEDRRITRVLAEKQIDSEEEPEKEKSK